MPQIVFPEFRDATRSTKYPFVDTATLTDTKKNLTLPNDIITDISLYIPGSYGVHYMNSIEVTNTSAKLRFTYGSMNYTARINLIESADNKEIAVPIYGSMVSVQTSRIPQTVDNNRTKTMRVGTLLINDLKLAYFKGLPVGSYTFSSSATEIVPSCIVTIPLSGVTSLSVNEREEDQTVSGNVWLIGYDGVFLRTDSNTPNSIRVDIVGDSMYKLASDNSYIVPKPLRTINGVKPDAYGNFVISTVSSYDALRIQTKPDSIQIYLAGAADGN